MRVHAALGLQSPVLLDKVYGANVRIPAIVEAYLAEFNKDREQFFLHAASLDIPRVGVSVSAPEPKFWSEILDLFD